LHGVPVAVEPLAPLPLGERFCHPQPVLGVLVELERVVPEAGLHESVPGSSAVRVNESPLDVRLPDPAGVAGAPHLGVRAGQLDIHATGA
ncbi:hypothetical protein, partial [Shewanella algae]|uniref:hypothetical protein n=1 Tax=Shewanella algae TaxID=38313 RepID=UPI00313C3EDD